MKTKIIIFIVLLVLTTAFLFIKTPARETEGNKIPNINSTTSTGNPNFFILGAVNNGKHLGFLTQLTPLGLNMWHTYIGYYNDIPSGKRYPQGWLQYVLNDSLFTSVDDYKSDVWAVLQRNKDYGYHSLMQRPKIEYLAFGQRSDYRCEYIPINDPNKEWWYAYDSATNYPDEPDPQYTEGIVKHCSVNGINNSPGFVVKKLRANREQANVTQGNLYSDTTYSWYIKPRIRIKPENATHEFKICTIYIINFGDTVFKYADIYGDYFKINNQQYNGNYIEEFDFQSSGQNLIINHGIEFNRANHNWSNPNEPCPIDFQVKWWAQCDMWIEYVRVDNDVAHRLLKGNDVQFNGWIQDEAMKIADGQTGHGWPYKFYMDEIEYNHIPCIKYVNNMLNYYNPNMSLTPVSNLAFFAPPPYTWSYEFSKTQIKRNADEMGLTEIFFDKYPLNGHGSYGQPSYVPVNLTTHPFDVEFGQLGMLTDQNTYETWLQNKFDDISLIRNGLATANLISSYRNIPFIFMEQTHSCYCGSVGSYTQREPSNEELDAMANLAISYGARGIQYFAYDSYLSNENGLSYQYSLSEPITAYPYNTPRLQNVYGQGKWEQIIKMNQRFKQWEPFIINFNNTETKSYNYRNEEERNNLLTSSYFPPVTKLQLGNENKSN